TKHLDCGHGGLFSLVSIFSTGTIKGLLLVEGGEDSEDHRLLRLQPNFSNTISNGLADIVEVRCFSLDHTTEANHGGDVLTISEPHCTKRKFETPWYFFANDVRLLYTCGHECLYSTFV